MAINYYLLLGVPPDADLRRIKAAYRSMAKRFHPDTNKGSEAAADLFRQLNEAYQVLTDKGLRARYDTEIDKQAAAEKQARIKPRKRSESIDPQKKFKNFLNSLLDALLTPEKPVAAAVSGREQRTVTKRPLGKPRKKPDFNFYYSLAQENGSTPYTKGGDGIYRRTVRTGVNRQKTGFRTAPGHGLLAFLLTGLWTFFRC